MLLDDDANTLLVLHSLLERTEVRVIECEDEICAMRYCAESEPRIDLLVADVVLKNTNGPAVVRQVRPLQPWMRLLFISGYSLSELQRRGLLRKDELESGGAAFLQKPFTGDQFLETVETLLGA
jgi:CheY-like chemotaxis protein